MVVGSVTDLDFRDCPICNTSHHSCVDGQHKRQEQVLNNSRFHADISVPLWGLTTRPLIGAGLLG